MSASVAPPPLPLVIVLVENEDITPNITNTLITQVTDDMSGLCMLVHDAPPPGPRTYNVQQTAYVWQKFGFHTRDFKLDNYIAGCDGVIAIISYATLCKSEAATQRIQAVRCRPLLVIVENVPVSAAFFPLKSSSADFTVVYDVGISAGTKSVRQLALEAFCTKMLRIVPKARVPTSQPAPLNGCSLANTEFMKQFEDCTLPISEWNHYGRLRMVYCALKEKGYNDTLDPAGWLCTNWRKYKTSIGHAHLWNYTLTRMWVELVHYASNPTVGLTCPSNFGKSLSFHEVFTAPENAYLQDGSLHKHFYTSGTLFSPIARAAFVPPDLIPTSKTVPNLTHIIALDPRWLAV